MDRTFRIDRNFRWAIFNVGFAMIMYAEYKGKRRDHRPLETAAWTLMNDASDN